MGEHVTREQLIAAMNAAEEWVSNEQAAEWEADIALHPEKFTEREKEMERAISMAYKILHAWNPEHSCHHVHTDWRKLVTEQTREPTSQP